MNDTLKIHFGNIVSSYLGPFKSGKFVFDGENVHMVKCPFQLLQKVNLQSDFTYIIEDVLRLHHEQFNCSATTLFAMWYFWWDEFKCALGEGCLLDDIVEQAQTILENLITSLSEISIKSNRMFDPPSHKYKSPTFCGHHSLGNSNKNNYLSKTSNQVPIGIGFSSRHFSPFSSSQETTDSFSSEVSKDEMHLIKMTNSLKEEMNKFVCKLSHGDLDLSDLILEVWIRQIMFSNDKQFKVTGINISSLSLPSSYSTVVDGLIVKSSLNTVTYQELMVHKQIRALVTRSVTFDYAHLGNSFKVNVTNNISSYNLEESEKTRWIKKCCSRLLELDVNLLLINGDIDPDIEGFCSSQSILVLHGIPGSTTDTIAEFLGEPPCTYLLDCDEGDVILNLSVEKWNLNDSISLSWKEEYFHIKIKDPVKVKPLTVFLCHPNNSVLSSMVHQFWHCAYRLHLATVENKVIPGSGDTEKWCYKKLLSLNNSVIYRTVAQGFKRYHENVLSKLLHGDSQEKLDEVSSKVQAWKSAMALCLLTLQINEE